MEKTLNLATTEICRLTYPVRLSRCVSPLSISTVLLYPYFSFKHSLLVQRVPHGVGSWKSLDRSSSKYADDEFSFYYGEWYNGYKHGYGIEINDSGVFSGTFYEGYRQGEGRVDFANGTTQIAEFVPQLQHRDRTKGIFRNPYNNGLSNGYTEILFPDGKLLRAHFFADFIFVAFDLTSSHFLSLHLIATQAVCTKVQLSTAR